jgi:hypothetical protein
LSVGVEWLAHDKSNYFDLVDDKGVVGKRP